MKILSNWLRSYVPGLTVRGSAGGAERSDRELASALTLRGLAVDGVNDLGSGLGLLFEMDITTNRVDAMNHYGIAREAAAIYGLPLAPLDPSLPSARSAPALSAKDAKGPIEIRIEAPELCGRFTARMLRDIRVGPSLGIVAERFKLLEQKLISNAVDATNYVTLAMGHPTHVFDAGKLEGGIILRRARKGERLRTLDGVERTLDPEDLVVADEKKALSLAGVMGGWETMITPETRNILVEAAWFDPAAIRRSGKRHGLHTDASHRFERGADFNAPPLASALVCQLLLSSGGWIEGELADAVVPRAAARTALRPSISLRHSEVRRILGATQGATPGSIEDGGGIEPESFAPLLEALGCSLKRKGRGDYQVALPSWRLDLEREIDLIEEIARVYGYNRFQNTLPPFLGAVVEPPHLRKDAAIRRCLLARGWSEAISSSFCSAADAEIYAAHPGSAVPIGNPLNEELGMLRPSLVPGMLTMLANNLNRNVQEVQLFEIGTAFSGNPDRVEERPALALGAAGTISGGAHLPARELDFYDLKGAVEEVLGRFAAPSVYFDAFPGEAFLDGDLAITPSWLHPFRSARGVAGGATVAWFGELHPGEKQRRKIRQNVYLGEVYLDRLHRLPLRQPVARELSRFQPVHRDFSFIFPARVCWQEIADALNSLHLGELASFQPREIFRDPTGKALPLDHYSILIGVTFQAAERTLRDEELQSYSQSIAGVLQSLGGKQRA